MTITRSGNQGTLTVDDGAEVSFSSKGKTTTVEVAKPYYLGGVPQAVAARKPTNLDVSQAAL